MNQTEVDVEPVSLDAFHHPGEIVRILVSDRIKGDVSFRRYVESTFFVKFEVFGNSEAFFLRFSCLRISLSGFRISRIFLIRFFFGLGLAGFPRLCGNRIFPGLFGHFSGSPAVFEGAKARFLCRILLVIRILDQSKIDVFAFEFGRVRQIEQVRRDSEQEKDADVEDD